MDRHGRPPANAQDEAFLEDDRWDDFGYKTLWRLIYVDTQGQSHTIGQVKIGESGLEDGSPNLRSSFTKLGKGFFSLGQDDEYYSNLQELENETRVEILTALRDVALDLSLFEQVMDEQVTRVSLMRGISESTVRNQYHRMARGGARLSPYSFSYSTPQESPTADPIPVTELSFAVQPGSRPPSNVHVIIGRNGVGKSFLLNNMANVLVRGETPESGRIKFRRPDDETQASRFANVVSVAFSAFDEFEPLRRQPQGEDRLKYSYIGLKVVAKTGAEGQQAPKSYRALASEFGKSVSACVAEPRRSRWRRALEILQSDPVFADAISQFANVETDETLRDAAREVFRNLSSGHKIVLLTMTRLVETVDEATLVLLDEPESHLHPPLLAAFIRALSDLLEDRNGVAIIATHSPVVLQEVPRSCVWKLRRAGDELIPTRPEIETFGENVGTLTQEVFGLEVTASGFHRTLQEAVDAGADYEDVMRTFDGQLGAEGRALAQSMAFMAQRR